jgi:hypothetical protein
MEELIETILSYKHSTPEQTIKAFEGSWIINEEQEKYLLNYFEVLTKQ